ncbi:hypothetical protein FAZ69_27010 [Trinickia terrae]|uniref:DUF4145 domain-containing protein n=1 Tax=Trinickia terrae TaxID=2571161 RepID=A0A4U1HKD4_9BURK|nr:hypothetical protein [Trinickia terrae]TKC81622.1 hypothetical protein FAZ69_27010 [Trinickia terrae]
MAIPLYFEAKCPRCERYGKFQISENSTDNGSVVAEMYHHDEWRTYDFGLFSVVSFCGSCNNFVCACVSVIHDEVKNSTASLENFSDEHRQLKQSKDLIINFDVPALFPPKYFPPLTVDIFDLYNQAEKCYRLQAWDAVGILCRKIIDIKSIHMWNARFPDKKPAQPLFARMKQLLVGDISGTSDDKNAEIRNLLDFDNIDHRLFYDMDNIRANGNDATHGLVAYLADDAESALIYTKNFMELSGKWTSSHRKK